jgi:nickel-dependent lactate racemase
MEGSRILNHRWSEPDTLTELGVIEADEIERISGGLMREDVPVALNKAILDYDLLLICGPTFPHEVVGFSGGNKYLFPGIAGPRIINFFHWLGALITNPAINGTKDTPVRRVVDRAAGMVPIPRRCFSLVVTHEGLHGVSYGTPEEAYSDAADLSAKIHMKYTDRSFDRVLSVAPAMYDDLWVAGKCMYKLEPVVADGGELIIYAPHVTEISYSHGTVLDTIGYHVRDYFRKQMDRFQGVPRGVIAHSTHVKGIGTFEDGVETPRVTVVLATGIPEARCRKVNLGYRDPETIDPAEWQGREDEGVLYVPRAGEYLFRRADGVLPEAPRP